MKSLIKTHLSLFLIVFFSSSIQSVSALEIFKTEDEPVTLDKSKVIDTVNVQAKSRINDYYEQIDIPALPSISVEQHIRLIPEIDIRERGGFGSQSDISILGGTADQAGLLINGVDFTDIRTGHQTSSLPFDADDVTGIQVQYGNNVGLTGALNYNTGRHSDKYFRANLSGGHWGYGYAHLSGSTGDLPKNGNVYGAVSYSRSDGYRTNTDFKNFNAYTRATVGDFDFQAGFQRRAFGANGFYSLKYPNQFEETSTLLTSLRYVKTINRWTINTYLSWRGNLDRYELIKDGDANHHKTSTIGFHLQTEYAVSNTGKLLLLGDVFDGRIKSSVLGEPMSEEEGDYKKAKVRDWGTAKLQYIQRVKKFVFNGSFGALFSPYGTTPIWNVGVDWNITEKTKVYATLSRTTRLPTFTDLYYTTRGYVSDPNLKPEKALTAMIGAAYAGKVCDLSAKVFYRKGTDIIDWVKESAESDWMSSQITSLQTFGVDADLTISPNRTIFKRIKIASGFYNTDKKANDYISKYALDYVRFKAALITDIKIGNGFFASMNASYYDRMGNWTDTDGSINNYDPYFLLNLGASYQIKMFEIYLQLNNLTDTKYYDYGGLVMPGFNCRAGLIFKI